MAPVAPVQAAHAVTGRDTAVTGAPSRDRRVGSRVMIKPLEDEQLVELSVLFDASQDFHAGWVAYPSTVPALWSYRDQLRSAGGYLYTVNRSNDDAVVGLISLDRVARGVWQTAELGCAVGAHFAGHGLMTDGLKLLLRHAFDELGLRRIEALVRADNHRSHRMLDAAGLQIEGVARGSVTIGGEPRDHVRWAVISADVTNANPTTPEGGDE